MNTAANLTTTVGGGLSLVNFLATSKKPSERVAIGEAHLNSAISVLAEMLDKRADHVSRPEIRELRRQHDE